MTSQKDILEFFEKTVENGGYRLDSVEGLAPAHLHDRLLRFFLLGVGVGAGSVAVAKKDEEEGPVVEKRPDCTSMGCYEGPSCSCTCHSSGKGGADDGQN